VTGPRLPQVRAFASEAAEVERYGAALGKACGRAQLLGFGIGIFQVPLPHPHTSHTHTGTACRGCSACCGHLTRGCGQGGLHLAINGTVLLVLYRGGVAVAAGEVRPGQLSTFMLATMSMQRALNQLSVLFAGVVKVPRPGTPSTRRPAAPRRRQVGIGRPAGFRRGRAACGVRATGAEH
jgi:hypothetical protein